MNLIFTLRFFLFFFFNDTATTEIYTLSLHDALPICTTTRPSAPSRAMTGPRNSRASASVRMPDRKSTRLNSSHTVISYAVFCLKKKKKTHPIGIKDREREDVDAVRGDVDGGASNKSN